MRILSSQLRAQVVKEMLSVWRDVRVRMTLIAPPLMQLLIFSFAATLEVRNVTVAILDRDGGHWSEQFIADLAESSFVGRVLMVPDRGAMNDAVEQRQALLAVDIPETFSRDVSAGRKAAIQVIVDGRRANSGQIALGYLETVAQRFSAQPQTTFTPDAIAVRHWFNPNLNYRWFIVPSLAGILTMFAALVITSLSIAREREMGTFDQLLVSPTTPTEIIIAKTVPALVIGTLMGNVMVGAGVFAFRIPFTGSYALLLLTMLLFILSVVGIGLMISSICATQQQAILGAFALGVPMILISGFATPVENMPTVLQWLSELVPLRHFLVIVQGTFLKALPARDVFSHLWPMAVIAAASLFVATIFVRSKLQ